MNIIIISRYLIMGAIFLVISIILLKKGFKIKSNVCENCNSKVNEGRVCQKCGSPIKDKNKMKNIFLVCGGASGMIAIFQIIKFIRIFLGFSLKLNL